VPDGLPEPNDPAFVDKIAPTLRELITITEGRALCLFTSHRNMNRAYDLLRRQVGYRCLVQGEMGRGALLRAFREDLHSVLFATASFWEGVDVQGEALPCGHYIAEEAPELLFQRVMPFLSAGAEGGVLRA
jgi:ATP-dependent DNA helicase DinG